MGKDEDVITEDQHKGEAKLYRNVDLVQIHLPCKLYKL
jgi:hypothetical protein